MQIIDKKISELIPYENNPRNNDDAVDAVANSIKAFGFKVPVVIDKDNVIVAGHTRLKAAKKLKLKTVPCVIADDLDENQIKAFRLADNKTGELALWDFDGLVDELADICNIDMSEFGFDNLMGEITGESAEKNDETNSDMSHFNYNEQYGVIVMCKDESEQEKIYNRLTEEGYECKVVAT